MIYNKLPGVVRLGTASEHTLLDSYKRWLITMGLPEFPYGKPLVAQQEVHSELPVRMYDTLNMLTGLKVEYDIL